MASHNYLAELGCELLLNVGTGNVYPRALAARVGRQVAGADRWQVGGAEAENGAEAMTGIVLARAGK